MIGVLEIPHMLRGTWMFDPQRLALVGNGPKGHVFALLRLQAIQSRHTSCMRCLLSLWDPHWTHWGHVWECALKMVGGCSNDGLRRAKEVVESS